MDLICTMCRQPLVALFVAHVPRCLYTALSSFVPAVWINRLDCVESTRPSLWLLTQADDALQCFLEVIAQIAEKRTEIILRRKLPRLFMAYPNYKLALGFGLHHGWAIEGSLGSNHKVRNIAICQHRPLLGFASSAIFTVCVVLCRWMLRTCRRT